MPRGVLPVIVVIVFLLFLLQGHMNSIVLRFLIVLSSILNKIGVMVRIIDIKCLVPPVEGRQVSRRRPSVVRLPLRYHRVSILAFKL